MGSRAHPLCCFLAPPCPPSAPEEKGQKKKKKRLPEGFHRRPWPAGSAPATQPKIHAAPGQKTLRFDGRGLDRSRMSCRFMPLDSIHGTSWILITGADRLKKTGELLCCLCVWARRSRTRRPFHMDAATPPTPHHPNQRLSCRPSASHAGTVM